MGANEAGALASLREVKWTYYLSPFQIKYYVLLISIPLISVASTNRMLPLIVIHL